MKEYRSQRSINYDKDNKTFEKTRQPHHWTTEKKEDENKSSSSFSETGDKKSENLSPMK